MFIFKFLKRTQLLMWAIPFLVMTELSYAQQSSETLARGAKAWKSSCAHCHNLRDAREFRDDQWKVIIMHMRVRAGLTGQQARDILAFLQATNDVEIKTVAMSHDDQKQMQVVTVKNGKAIYEQTCIVCHGKNGKGTMPGVPDLTGNTSPLKQAEDVLFNRVINGYQSPGSVMAMPPKGGDPSLTEEDIRQVLDYMQNAFLKQ